MTSKNIPMLVINVPGVCISISKELLSKPSPVIVVKCFKSEAHYYYLEKEMIEENESEGIESAASLVDDDGKPKRTGPFLYLYRNLLHAILSSPLIISQFPLASPSCAFFISSF
ncbi:hypothetical protein VNO77_30637 [Canavalia gladiata]|uniref:Uncharacterized protein n=1 Tax=Canavalia gladiata TaxID=3824 RepID=A0AAN9Q3C3_CANGL